MLKLEQFSWNPDNILTNFLPHICGKIKVLSCKGVDVMCSHDTE